jgi:hypothetical protein
MAAVLRELVTLVIASHGVVGHAPPNQPPF